MKQIRNEQLIESNKETKPLNFTVNVITSYEYEEQEIFDVNIKDIYPSKICPMSTEVDVLLQVVDEMKRYSANNLDYLRMISLCYIHDTISIDGELQDTSDTPETYQQFLEELGLWEAINRSNGKYCFQPNQRDIVVKMIVNTFNVGKLTPDFDESLYQDIR